MKMFYAKNLGKVIGYDITLYDSSEDIIIMPTDFNPYLPILVHNDKEKLSEILRMASFNMENVTFHEIEIQI